MRCQTQTKTMCRLTPPADQSVEPKASVAERDMTETHVLGMQRPDVLLSDTGATLSGCYDCAPSNCSDGIIECDIDETCRVI